MSVRRAHFSLLHCWPAAVQQASNIPVTDESFAPPPTLLRRPTRFTLAKFSFDGSEKLTSIEAHIDLHLASPTVHWYQLSVCVLRPHSAWVQFHMVTKKNAASKNNGARFFCSRASEICADGSVFTKRGARRDRRTERNGRSAGRLNRNPK
jgi:hypothetical protein